MAIYQLTNKAVEDLANIWDYTFEKWSAQQADKYYTLLLASCQAIADNPGLGKNYTRITNELFGLKINRHIIFYRKFLRSTNRNNKNITRTNGLKKQDK